MERKTDIRLGNFIKNKREYLKLTQQEVADYVKVSKSAVSRWESGDIGSMGIDKLPRLSEILEISPLELVNLDKEFSKERKPNNSNTKPIPLLGTIAAGLPILAEENIKDFFNLDRKIKADFALEVKGDSMINAGIYDGDIVFIKKQDCLENGQIGAVQIEDMETEATLKKFYYNNGVVQLLSENPNNPPQIYTEGNVKILGKLVAVLNIRE